MNRMRVSLNLIHYFQDHRQLAKVFIKNDMKLIEDLHNHIVKIFNIDKNFYLLCENHFLPSIEDIHILNDSDVVYVIPSQPNSHLEKEKTIIKKKKKNYINLVETNSITGIKNSHKKNKKHNLTETLETRENQEAVIANNNDEYMEINIAEQETDAQKVTKKKEKRKKRKLEEDCPENLRIITNKSVQLMNEEYIETNTIDEGETNIETPKKKKRKNEMQTPEIIYNNLSENIEINKSNIKEINNVENNSPKSNNSESFEKSINISKRNKTFCNRKEDDSKNTPNETVIFKESNKFDAIFTNQNDFTVISSDKQNDLIVIESDKKNDLTATGSDKNTEHNYVNESRRKRRRCISPCVLLTVERNSVTDTNLNNNFSIENSNKGIVRTVEHLSSHKHNEILRNIKKSPRHSYSLTDMLHFKNQISSSPATNEIQTILEKTSILPVTKPSRKQLSGVGKVLEFLNIENENSDLSQNNNTAYPIPKRKRIRTRKRKQKNNDSSIESKENYDNCVFIPPKTIAAPKFHIKFEDDLNTYANSVEGEHYAKSNQENFDSQNGIVHSTPLDKAVNTMKTSVNITGLNRISINNLISNKLSLLNGTPLVNKKILFQKLKLGPNYNPMVSNLILGEIQEVSKNGNELHIKILDGHEELENPIGGKFSCIAEEEYIDYDKVHVFELNTLIEPKIVDDFESQ